MKLHDDHLCQALQSYVISVSIPFTHFHSHTDLDCFLKKSRFSLLTKSTSCLLIWFLFMTRCTGGTYGQTCRTTSNLCSIINPCTATNSCQSGDGTAKCQCPAGKFDASVGMSFLLSGYLLSFYFMWHPLIASLRTDKSTGFHLTVNSC